MKTLSLLFSLVCLLGLAGCLPVSQNPLSAPEEAAADSHLPGVWYGKSGEDEIFLHFVPGQAAEMQIVEVDHEKKGEAHTTLYSMFPTVIGGQHYLNVREGKNKPYYLARYHLSDAGALTIWLMSEKAAAKAINSRKLKGQVVEKQQSSDRDVTLSDTTEHLAAFVRKSDPQVLFDQKFGTFKKVTLPAVEPEAKSAPSKKKKKAS